MSVEEIKIAIVQLSPEECAQLAAWFDEFQAEAWDRESERDVEAGRLDRLIRQAEEAFEVGQHTVLLSESA